MQEVLPFLCKKGEAKSTLPDIKKRLFVSKIGWSAKPVTAPYFDET